MAKAQFTNRQKSIIRVMRDRRDLQKAKITARAGSLPKAGDGKIKERK